MLTSITFLISKVISQTACICRIYPVMCFSDNNIFTNIQTLIFHKVDSHISQVNLVDGNKANNTPYSLLFVRSEYFFS